MGAGSGGSSTQQSQTEPSGDARILNALRAGNTTNFWDVNGGQFPQFGQPSPYALPGEQEQAMLSQIAQRGQQLGPSPMQQQSIDWLQSAGPNYLNQVNQTGQTAYNNLQDVGALMRQEYGTQRTELGQLGNQMQDLYNTQGGNLQRQLWRLVFLNQVCIFLLVIWLFVLYQL